jgi:hypothetical protein
MKNLATLLFGIFLAGCASQPSKPAAPVDIGQAPDSKISSGIIAAQLRKAVNDPESLRINCDDARKGWLKDNMFRPAVQGWVIHCEVNPKNRFGGYDGYRSVVYLFRGNRLVLEYDLERSRSIAQPARGRHFDYDR